MIGIFVLIIAQWSHSFHTRLSPRPGPEFWPAHQILIRSPGCPDQFFFLNQNNVILVKKKTKVNRVAGSRRVFSFLIFFNPAWLQPRVPGRPLGRVSKLWMEQCMPKYIYMKFSLFITYFPTQTKEGIKTRHICNNNKEKCW
jgi:hypothetical protein